MKAVHQLCSTQTWHLSASKTQCRKMFKLPQPRFYFVGNFYELRNIKYNVSVLPVININKTCPNLSVESN